jgi:hypothetical protein
MLHRRLNKVTASTCDKGARVALPGQFGAAEPVDENKCKGVNRWPTTLSAAIVLLPSHSNKPRGDPQD